MYNLHDKYLHDLLVKHNFTLRMTPAFICDEKLLLVIKSNIADINTPLSRINSTIAKMIDESKILALRPGELIPGRIDFNLETSANVIIFKSSICGVNAYIFAMPTQFYTAGFADNYSIENSVRRIQYNLKSSLSSIIESPVEHSDVFNKLFKKSNHVFELAKSLHMQKSNKSRLSFDGYADICSTAYQVYQYLRTNMKFYDFSIETTSSSFASIARFADVNQDALKAYFESIFFNAVSLSTDQRVELRVDVNNSGILSVLISTGTSVSNSHYANRLRFSGDYMTLENLSAELLKDDYPFSIDLLIAQDFIDKNKISAYFKYENGKSIFYTEFKTLTDGVYSGNLILRRPGNAALEKLFNAYRYVLFSKSQNCTADQLIEQQYSEN